MKNPQPVSLPWNLVTKNLHGHELLRKKLHEKITKLDKHLEHFPPGTVHLQIVLERHPRKPLHTAALNLRLPSNILHSEKSAPDVIKAFDDAIKSLLRELESLKADLRRETFWKRKARREQLRELRASGFATEPMAEGTGPQELKDVVGELFQQHYSRLVRHARRHIRHDELTGDLPQGAVEAREIVDEVGRKVLAKAEAQTVRRFVHTFEFRLSGSEEVKQAIPLPHVLPASDCLMAAAKAVRISVTRNPDATKASIGGVEVHAEVRGKHVVCIARVTDFTADDLVVVQADVIVCSEQVSPQE